MRATLGHSLRWIAALAFACSGPAEREDSGVLDAAHDARPPTTHDGGDHSDAADPSDAGPHDAGGTFDAGTFDAGMEGGVPVEPEWEWVNPLPQGNRLRAVSLSSPTDGWAVGGFGTAIRFESGRWTPVPTPTRATLRAVHAISPTDAWAGGDDGFMRWKDGAWHSVDGATATIVEIWASGPDFALANAGEHTLLHWDGTRWGRFPDDAGALPSRLRRVTAASADDFWVVGTQDRTAVLLHYVHGTFQRIPLPLGGINDLHARAVDDAWMVSGLEVAHWNGVEWRRVDAPLPVPYGDEGRYYRAVRAGAADNVWFVGPFQNYRFDGVGFTGVDVDDRASVLAIAALGSTVIAAGGLGGLAQRAGDALVADTVDPLLDLWADGVWGADSSDVWVGSAHWNGAELHAVPDPDFPSGTRAVDGTASNDVFFVGRGGEAAHWNGSDAARIDTGTTAHLNGVVALSPARAIAVGAVGTVLELTSTGVTPHYSGTTASLNAVWAASTDDIFAVGDSGTILRYRDGAGWALMPTDITSRLYGIRGRSATEAYAVGEDGFVLGFDGIEWRRVPTASSNEFRSVAFDGSRWWVVGRDARARGVVFTWDGAHFAEHRIPGTESPLTSIVAVALHGELWTVAGNNGLVLRRGSAR